APNRLHVLPASERVNASAATSGLPGLAEDELAHAGLEEHRVEELEAAEQGEDVTVLQRSLAAARSGNGAVAEMAVVFDDVARVAALGRATTAEECEQRAARPEGPHERSGERRRRRRGEVVEDVPAQHRI